MMDETPEIQPALADWSYVLRDLPVGASEDFITWCETYYGTSVTAHEAAALALHEQPFGFTHADVADEMQAYHDTAMMARRAQDDGNEGRRQQLRDRAARHRIRADKLAALLPPKEE